MTLRLTAFSIMTFSIITFSIMTFSIMTFSIMTFSIMTFSIMTFSIMTFSIMTFSIMKLSITIYKKINIVIITKMTFIRMLVMLIVNYTECHLCRVSHTSPLC
jgi:hypothetical protein